MLDIQFEKYQGNGNDFIIIDSRTKNIHKYLVSHKLFSIKDLCHRNFGIGADGVIFIMNPDKNNDAKMIIYNSDNSEAEMCGNGIRCMTAYLYHSSKSKTKFNIETKAGIKIANYINKNISVKMGKPIIDNKLIPTTLNTTSKGIPFAKFEENNFSEYGYAVGMGNPHLIFFVNNISKIPLLELGPKFEKNKFFPEKTNVHFCQILDRDKIKVKVWERGAGPTLACGTGACSVHVAAYKLDLCNAQTKIILPGGDLNINWSDDNEEVNMTGEAKKIYRGSFTI